MTISKKRRTGVTMTDAEHVCVRLAVPRDLDALVALEQSSFDGDRMSARQYLRHLGSDSAHVLIATPSGSPARLLGSAVVFFRRRSTVARLYSLAVQPQARGRGVGVALLEAVAATAALRGCRALRLEVRSDNSTAIRLYERHGFAPVGHIDAYYEDGGDALRYELPLQRD